VYAYVTQPLMRGRHLRTMNRAWEDLMTKNIILLCHWKRHHILLLLVRHMLIASDLLPVRFFFFFYFLTQKVHLVLFIDDISTSVFFFFWFVFVLDHFIEVLFAFNFIIQSQFCNMLFFPISSWLFYLDFFMDILLNWFFFSI
jgi:hypothetical protein